MRRGYLVFSLLALGVASRTSPALAFSDPERFTAPTHEGGGGGRFFTGSPADGFTCAVCHRGGVAPMVGISGMPTTGFSAGQVVEAEVIFTSTQGNHSLALEVVDDAGRDLGLEILPETEVPVTERCGATQDARRASYITEVGARRVLGVEACEARTVRFRFRTPQSERILLAATVLASDNSATIEGDGVHEISAYLYRDGRSARAAADSGCGVRTERASFPVSLGLLVLALLWRLRARRAR